MLVSLLSKKEAAEEYSECMSKREDYINQSPSIKNHMSRTYSVILLVKDEHRGLLVAFTGTAGSVDTLHGRNHSDDRDEKDKRQVERSVGERCIGEELMKTFQPTSPHVIWRPRPISLK